MVAIRTRHTSLKVGKLDVRNSFWRGNQLAGVTRSSTIVAQAPSFQEVANINFELLHEAVGGHFPSTCVSANLGAKQQPTTAILWAL